ncbi:caspase-1-like isoform X2 [Nylanderia fulva]|uniref:caspase-1-like isoform X2 n=1 Tax=Nylanderia fulva TaxID=613905 RepID=UPI0010FB95E3|nr:caspase-1-like isoform X2 [Nylanderia fulva]
MSSTKSEDDTSKDQKDEVECVRPFAKNSLEPKRMLRPWLTDEDSNYYKMDHSKRGIAVIFNQENFTNLNLPLRSGAIDCDNLNFTLRNLGFEVSLCQNKTLKNIRKTLKTVANTDHSESDCLIIVVLSFGKHDYLYASDTSYKVESLCNYFTADKCPTLAGKPKLFFIQAGCCNVIKPGTSCEQRGTEDLSKATFRIEPDFLIVYSAIPMNSFYPVSIRLETEEEVLIISCLHKIVFEFV